MNLFITISNILGLIEFDCLFLMNHEEKYVEFIFICK